MNYPESDARERLNEELLPLLPDELAALLVERTITQTVDGEVYTCTDKLWPLSAVEVFGKDAPDWMQRDDTPDKPLPFFAKSQSNQKAYLWCAWLRSPSASSSGSFCNVYTSGAAATTRASFSRGVAPGFRVGIKAKTAEPAQD